MKSRHKITLLFTLLVTLILLGVSFSVYYFASLERRQLFKKRLTARANNNAQIYSYFGDSSRPVLNHTNSMEMLPRRTVEIFTLTGRLIYRYHGEKDDSIRVDADVIGEAIRSGEYLFEDGTREAIAIRYSDEKVGRFIVAVAAFDHDGWLQLEKLRRIFILTLLIGIAATLVAGTVFSKQLLKPVARIISEVNDISSNNLSHRIPVNEPRDELDQLAATFNKLLDRLQESFIAQRRFISNASHELSTPLTSISSQLQVTLQRERSTEEYRGVMQSVQEDVVQMRELTKSLLEIAKTGASDGIELKEVRIDEVLLKVMGDVKKGNPHYAVELDFQDPTPDDWGFLVFGNSDLLYIAVKNLVENGCKYSIDNTSRVRLSFADSYAIIEVNNNGEAIASDEMENIFHPFYRSANAAGKTGFGLGLALALRIARLHKGSLEVISDEARGTCFKMILPRLKK